MGDWRTVGIFALLAACSSGSGPAASGPPCLPAICGRTYQCVALDGNGNPVGAPSTVTLGTNAQGACVSTVGGAQHEAIYECDGSVTSSGSTVSTWTAADKVYTVCGSGCIRCTGL